MRKFLSENGQIFDAYKFALKLIHKAKASLIIIDNFIDETVLTMCSEAKKGINISIITRELSKK